MKAMKYSGDWNAFLEQFEPISDVTYGFLRPIHEIWMTKMDETHWWTLTARRKNSLAPGQLKPGISIGDKRGVAILGFIRSNCSWTDQSGYLVYSVQNSTCREMLLWGD